MGTRHWLQLRQLTCNFNLVTDYRFMTKSVLKTLQISTFYQLAVVFFTLFLIKQHIHVLLNDSLLLLKILLFKNLYCKDFFMFHLIDTKLVIFIVNAIESKSSLTLVTSLKCCVDCNDMY